MLRTIRVNAFLYNYLGQVNKCEDFDNMQAFMATHLVPFVIAHYTAVRVLPPATVRSLVALSRRVTW